MGATSGVGYVGTLRSNGDSFKVRISGDTRIGKPREGRLIYFSCVVNRVTGFCWGCSLSLGDDVAGE